MIVKRGWDFPLNLSQQILGYHLALSHRHMAHFWTFETHAVPKSAFQDSVTCINYGDPSRSHPCNECHLVDFVSSEHLSDEIPCHFIPLNDAGETIEDLQAQDNQAKLEATLTQWMRAKIMQIEERRSKLTPKPTYVKR